MKTAFKFLAIGAITIAGYGCGGGSSGGQAVTVTPPPPPPPSGQRYRDKIFTSVEIDNGVVFGTGLRSSGNHETLRMNICMPQSDTDTDRAVAIFAFGGSFVFGSRFSPNMTRLCNDYAQRGYVAAAIDYRLFETTPTDYDGAAIGMLQAMHDMKAAVRFFREDAATNDFYGTSGDEIFVGGVSAGGIMASLAGTLDASDTVTPGVQAFLDANGGFDGNSSTNTQYSSRVDGVLSLSGATHEPDWVEADSAPIYAVHEELDDVVPCDFSAGSGGFPLAGGCIMTERALNAGLDHELYLIAGATTHVAYSDSDWDNFLAGSSDFFADHID